MKNDVTIIKFYYIMGVFPLYYLNNSAICQKYEAKIIPLLDDFISKNKSKAYHKYYTNTIMSNLDNIISDFINDNASDLNSNEIYYLKGLDNLTKQIKRYVRGQKAQDFPNIFLDLTHSKLKQYITDLSKASSIDPKIIFLEDPLYLAIYYIIKDKNISAFNFD